MKASQVQQPKAAPATDGRCLPEGDTRLLIKRRKFIIQRRLTPGIMATPPSGLFRVVHS
jgi:hypothetical protein